MTCFGCTPQTPAEPRSWTQVLQAERLEHVSGGARKGPFVAGQALWQTQGDQLRTVRIGTPQWRAIWVSATDEAWAVGTAGKVARLRSGEWVLDTFGTGQTGIDICAWGEEAWIPVTNGEIHRLRAGTWTSWKPNALADRHTGVLWGASPKDVWMHTHQMASGVPPDLGHWDGQNWSFHSLSRSGYIASMHGSASDDIWAVGWTVKWIGKGPLVAHWDGARWSEVTVPTRDRLTDVKVAKDGTVWISGLDGTLLRGNIKAFRVVEAPKGTLSSVYPAADGSVWVVVDGQRLMKSVTRP